MEEPIIEMYLCEANYVHLQAGVLYRFEVNQGCKDCVEFDKKAKARQVKLEEVA